MTPLLNDLDEAVGNLEVAKKEWKSEKRKGQPSTAMNRVKIAADAIEGQLRELKLIDNTEKAQVRKENGAPYS